MNKEKQKVWDRLKNGVKPKRKHLEHPWQQIFTSSYEASIAMQQLGRAFRTHNHTIVPTRDGKFMIWSKLK